MQISAMYGDSLCVRESGITRNDDAYVEMAIETDELHSLSMRLNTWGRLATCHEAASDAGLP
jgi:hypothetical protein